MKTFLIYLEYDGTNFHGYQRQPQVRTVQGELERALCALFNQVVSPRGSSRTDQGVHARQYPVSFQVDTTIPGEKVCHALNSFLPDDIRVLESREMSDDFDARGHALGKTYSYRVLNRPMASSLYRNYSYWLKAPLDVEAMREAAGAFIGTHDFTGFKSMGSSDPNPIKEMTKITIDEEGEFLVLYFTGSGFLYNMARIMAGTLVDVGLHRMTKEEIQGILISKVRGRAMVLPPQGLYLEKVYYEK